MDVAIADETAATILLSDPDITRDELAAAADVLQSPRLSCGDVTRTFEEEFAACLGRRHAIAVSSGTMGAVLALKALGIGPGDDVITTSFSHRETASSIEFVGANTVFAEIDYWSGTLAPEKLAARITPRTKAILAGNTNGHPADWAALRAIATDARIAVIEDSTECIGSTYRGALAGSFGDLAVFDFSQNLAITCGEGGMVVTDDAALAETIVELRGRAKSGRGKLSGSVASCHARLSDLAAAIGLAQLRRLDSVLERRRTVQAFYLRHVRSFEGIKDPYSGPDVGEINWFLYVVHLGTRFSRSSRDAIVEDLRVAGVEACAYTWPLHLQPRFAARGHKRGDLFVTEKLADRAICLPFHAHLTDKHVGFIVETMKDASVNVGAGSAIY